MDNLILDFESGLPNEPVLTVKKDPKENKATVKKMVVADPGVALEVDFSCVLTGTNTPATSPEIKSSWLGVTLYQYNPDDPTAFGTEVASGGWQLGDNANETNLNLTGNWISVIPLLAGENTFTNGTTYAFKIQWNVKYLDGTELKINTYELNGSNVPTVVYQNSNYNVEPQNAIHSSPDDYRLTGNNAEFQIQPLQDGLVVVQSYESGHSPTTLNLKLNTEPDFHTALEPFSGPGTFAGSFGFIPYTGGSSASPTTYQLYTNNVEIFNWEAASGKSVLPYPNPVKISLVVPPSS